MHTLSSSESSRDDRTKKTTIFQNFTPARGQGDVSPVAVAHSAANI